MKTHEELIAEAEAECMKAWAANPNAEFGWCIHHDELIEKRTYPYAERMDCIKWEKPENEQIARFRNFRPVLSELPEKVAQALRGYADGSMGFCTYKHILKDNKPELERLHALDVPNHTWSGKDIYGGENVSETQSS